MILNDLQLITVIYSPKILHFYTGLKVERHYYQSSAIFPRHALVNKISFFIKRTALFTSAREKKNFNHKIKYFYTDSLHTQREKKWRKIFHLFSFRHHLKDNLWAINFFAFNNRITILHIYLVHIYVYNNNESSVHITFKTTTLLSTEVL